MKKRKFLTIFTQTIDSHMKQIDSHSPALKIRVYTVYVLFAALLFSSIASAIAQILNIDTSQFFIGLTVLFVLVISTFIEVLIAWYNRS